MRWRVPVGAAVLAVWMGAIGLHVRREYFRPEAVVLAQGARALAPGTYFYAVSMAGRVIGLASSRLDTVPDGFLFEDLLRLNVPALDTVHPAVVRTRAHLGRALELRDFDFRLQSEIGDFHVTGEARPDSTLALRLDTGAGAQETSIALERGLTLPVALPLRIAAGGRLEVGTEYSARVLDPSALSSRGVLLKVVGRDMLEVVDSVAAVEPGGRWAPARLDTVPVWVVEETYGGVSVRSWLDGDGRLVKAESPMGFTLERAPYELARQRWTEEMASPSASAGYGAVIENTAIASNVALRGAEGRLERMVVRLRNVDLTGFDLDGGRQTLRGDTLTVEREPAAAMRADYTLPYTGGGEPASELEATPLIQVDDPAIRAAAVRAVRGSTDPAEAARRLAEWVHGYLRKDVTLSIPSATQVLEARRGDCNEHTVLYVAMARSLGLPARTAVGLVHVGDRFYYHAWPEVWLDGWVAVDPTLGQVPADASHIRFLVGGLARQVELIRLIGRLDLDILGTRQ